MLTLTRSVGERIYIGDDIVIEVRAILDGRQVRISIDAPRQVPIHRAEIFEAVSRQNRSAALAGDAGNFTRLLAAERAEPAAPATGSDGVDGVEAPPVPTAGPASQVGGQPAAPEGGSAATPL